MRMMGFLPLNKEPEQVDRALLEDFWVLLRGEDNNGVSLDTLKVIMINLIGVRTPERE